MNQLESLCDSRFNYAYDNPFNGPNKKECLNKLKDYIYNNVNDFKNINWITDSRCFNIPLKKAFNDDIPKLLSDNELLCYYTSNFLNNINTKLSKPLINDLQTFALNNNKKPIITNLDKESQNDDEEKKQNITTNYAEEEIENENEEIEQPNLTYNFGHDFDSTPMVYKSNNDLCSYDIRQNKTLTYQEVCELTLNLARSQLQNIIKKDESVLFAESREKNRLITELNKYLKNSEISTKLNLQPDNLSIAQLQQSLEQAKELYDTIKVTHVVEKGLDLFNIGYTYIFPDGIKIPKKNKAIKLNGVTGTFKQLLFDRTSPLNIAFKNILEKHHISISDEFVVGLSSIEAILKKIEIVDIEPEKNKTVIESISESEENENSTEESNVYYSTEDD